MILKEAKKVYRRWLMRGYLNELRYKIFVKKDFNTAAWSPIEEGGEIVNHVFMGDQIFESFGIGKEEEQLVSALMYHELGHSRFTMRDFKLLNRQCELHNIPFELFNLFEDARMEHLVSETFDYEFKWAECSKVEAMGFGHYAPEALMLGLIYHEGAEDATFVEAFVKAGVEKGKTEEEVNEIVERITGYYYPAILKQKTSMRLFPLMAEWRDEFTTQEQREQEEQQKALEERLKELAQHIADALGGTKPEDGEGDEEAGGSGVKQLEDLALSQQLSEDAQALAAFLNGAKDATPSSEKPEAGGAGDKLDDFQCNTYSLEEHTTADLTRRKSHLVDTETVRKLLPKFEKVLKAPDRKMASTRPSKRFHGRNLINDRDKFYKRKEEIQKSRKEVTFVVDCSGSMGSPMKVLKTILAIGNELTKKGSMSGHIILSSTYGYQTFKMPVAQEVLENIAGEYGGEGLDETFAATLPILSKADLVFCITDGDIGSRAVDQKMLRRHGVDPIGMYCGREPVNLSRWFTRTVWRRDIESLIDELVRKAR